jgi:hypothetical protein
VIGSSVAQYAGSISLQMTAANMHAILRRHARHDQERS